MATTGPETTFAAATAVKPVSSHTYEAEFPDDWCIGSVPHGGFVTSVFMQVASTHFSTTLSSQNQPHTIAVHLDFLRRTQVGLALFTVKDIKVGRQTTVIHITLSQDGREVVIGTLTQSNLDAETGVSFPTTWTLTPPPLPVDLSLLSQDKDEKWTMQKELPFSHFRRATKKSQFYFPRQGQRSKGSADEWIRLASGEKWTNTSIGYVADMWPMPVESFIHTTNPYDVHEPSATSQKNPAPARFWYPTVLLNLDVKKALPAEGVEWLFARVDTKQIKNGRLDIEVVILDEEGDIVALSHHISLAVGTERNLAGRTKGASKI